MSNAAGESGNGESNENSISPFVYMGEILEKLRILQYDRKLKLETSITSLYFITADNKSEQFRTFVTLTVWLLRDYLKMDFREPDLYMEDPLTIATDLSGEFQKLNLKVSDQSLSAMKLRLGYGIAVLECLHALLDLALKKQSFSFQMPKYPKSMLYVEEQEDVEDSDEDNIIDDTTGAQVSDREEEDEDFAQYYLASERQGIAGESNEDDDDDDLENQVDPEEWQLELEQVEPQLVLKLAVDHKDWRYHVDSISSQQQKIDGEFESTVQGLSRLSDEVSKVVERIKKRESLLSQDNTIYSLLQDYKRNQDKLKEVTETYKKSEGNVTSLSNDLNVINQELTDIKSKVDELSKKMGDTTPLQEIKKAQSRIKREIREMSLRSGVLEHKLLQAKQKTLRAMSADQFNRDQRDAYSDDFMPGL